MTAPIWIVSPPAQALDYNEAGNEGRLGDFARPRKPASFQRSGRPRTSPAFKNGFVIQALAIEQISENLGGRPFVNLWSDLASRSLEPNAFFEPGFALSAARHFPVKSRPHFIAVLRPNPVARSEPRLVGLFPLAPASVLAGDGLASLWLNKQAALASPLVDKDCAVEVLARFLDWLGENHPASGIRFPRLVKDGPLHSAILAAAQRTQRAVATLDEFERAVLFPGSDPDELWLRGASKKALKDLHRRQRRLAEHGPVHFALVSSPPEVRAATEQYLALEASGWKGASGAFLSHPSLTTFLRSATRLLARYDKCRIASLTLRGKPLAMAILIESQGRAYFWKIAFDEQFRSQAPGIHLVHELTRALSARSDLEMTDSCAIANHPMIDRFWPDRLAICDIAVQTCGDRANAFHEAWRAEALRRRLRAFAKRIMNKLSGRKEN